MNNNEEMYRNITNAKVVDFLNSYYKPQSQAMNEFRLRSETAGVPVLQRDAERLLLQLLKLKKPRRIIEIGTAVGYSACCMAHALPEAEIVTFERSDEMCEKATHNIAEFGFEKRITIMQGDAAENLEKLPEAEKFDFAFIDAAKGHYRDFFDRIMPHMNAGGVIVCDNMLFKARVVSDEYDESRRYKTEVRRMRAFIDYLFSLNELDTSYLSVGDGTTISIINDDWIYINDK